MQKRTIVIVIVIVAVALATGGFFLSSSLLSSEEPAQDYGSFPEAPASGGGGGVTAPVTTLFLTSTLDGVSIIAHDFTKDLGTKRDEADLSVYHLVGSLGSPYLISYSATTKIFTITVYQEPVGAYRAAASNELVKILKISNLEACLLPTVITIAPEANPHYANKNLGFSFCPGATALPE